MAEHTPTPWRVHGIYTEEIYATVDDKRHMVTEVCGAGTVEQDTANAALIVLAVNNHYALINALTEIAKGEGRFSRDPLTHASNTIDDMKQLATDALVLVGGSDNG